MIEVLDEVNGQRCQRLPSLLPAVSAREVPLPCEGLAEVQKANPSSVTRPILKYQLCAVFVTVKRSDTMPPASPSRTLPAHTSGVLLVMRQGQPRLVHAGTMQEEHHVRIHLQPTAHPLAGALALRLHPTLQVAIELHLAEHHHLQVLGDWLQGFRVVHLLLFDAK